MNRTLQLLSQTPIFIINSQSTIHLLLQLNIIIGPSLIMQGIKPKRRLPSSKRRHRNETLQHPPPPLRRGLQRRSSPRSRHRSVRSHHVPPHRIIGINPIENVLNTQRLGSTLLLLRPAEILSPTRSLAAEQGKFGDGIDEVLTVRDFGKGGAGEVS